MIENMDPAAPIVGHTHVRVPGFDSNGGRRTTSQMVKLALDAELKDSNNFNYSDTAYSRNYAINIHQSRRNKVIISDDDSGNRRGNTRNKLRAQLAQKKITK